MRFQMRSFVLAVCVLLATAGASAQKKPAAQSNPNATRQILIDKAKALESRGRPDMAIQLWQQVLLSDPKNAEALAGLAKDLRLTGAADQSNAALEKLRKVNPSDPNIGRIGSMVSTKQQYARLKQAGDLSRQGRTEEAMKIYRDQYGDHPPDGDIGLAYYQTLYGTANGKAQAIAGLRAMAARNPGDDRYAVELGIMLTYDGRTRAEGIRVLREHPKNINAQNALRQALLWDAANPSAAAELRAYLKEHPQDSEIAQHLKEDEGKLAQMNSGIARNPEERAAYAALNAKRLDEAQQRFMAILEREPTNGRAAAGMGFLRMQQNNFGGAISYLTEAEENGFRERSVVEALESSRFWYTMSEASQAFDDNQLDVAAEKYKAALVMRPKSREALNGLAGLLIKQQRYADAAGVYEQLLKIAPQKADAWRGLFFSYARQGQSERALGVLTRVPAGERNELARDPEYLRTLATIYHSLGRQADAQRVLAQALALPFPDEGANLKEGTRLQYAGILMEAKRYAQAIELYTQVLDENPNSLPAWMGLVSAHHELGADNQSIADVEKMPPSVYDAALSDVGFMSMLGAIYQQANQFDIAQGLLERSVKMQMKGGGQPTLELQLQLAAIYLERNNTAQAYAIYRQILLAHPDRVDAWKGLIGTLQATHREREALAEIALIPPAVRQKLESDNEFVQGEASMYASAGDTVHAIEYMNRVLSHYRGGKSQVPSKIELQYAWLLFNTKNDRQLYPVLMELGGRRDLTVTERQTVQEIWANWSVRRATTAMDNGNAQRSIDILDAALLAFPNNLTVRKAVAGGYARVGRSREAMLIFRDLPMQDASSGDFQGAIGAALQANDKGMAETWLRQALERFPRDPAILSLAARFEQARGDNQRAADYWRAALAVMPNASPTDRLAHTLAYPEEDTRARKAVTAADLQRLLDPNNEPFAKTVKLPPLPAYGADPYSDRAPVVLQPQATEGHSRNQTNPWQSLQEAPIEPAAVPRQQYEDPVLGMQSAPTAEVVPEPVVPMPQSHSGTQVWGDNERPAVRAALPAAKSDRPNLSHYSGQMHLPANRRQQPVTSDAAPIPPVTESWNTQAPAPASGSHVLEGKLRLSNEAMDEPAARAQAFFAEQTDGQLTQTASDALRPLPLATHPLEGSVTAPATEGKLHYNMAQYTPSAQEAATGAYSAPQENHPAQQPTQTVPPASTSSEKKKATREVSGKAPAHTRKSATGLGRVPTLASAPAAALPGGAEQDETRLDVTDAPAQVVPTAATGLSDDELAQRNLPPLRGPWVRVQREQRKLTPRDEAEMQLRSIESGYSGWLGGSGVINYRSGDLGYDHMAAFEAPIEVTTPIGYSGRFAIVARPVFLDSGQADGNSVITVQENPTTTSTTLVSIPQPIGTLTATDSTPPTQQNAAGIGAEAQLVFPTFAIAGGSTPYGFLVQTFTARFMWHPGNGPITITGSRDSVKDTQLSYAGLRDPAGNTQANQGQIWGGVIANQGQIQYAHGNAESGFYLGMGGQYLTGYKVLDNTRIDGSAGAYWRAHTFPEYGYLSLGANFFVMHYAHNEDAFTYGMGGYFSPQAYFLGNMPVTWVGHYGTRWHYNVLGSFGIQAFEQQATNLWPFTDQASLETSLYNAKLPAKTSVGPNYDLKGQMAYQISPHWFAGGFLTANNSRDYKSATAGFYIRYLFRSQPSTVTNPTGIFPSDGFRPFMVP